MLAPGKEEGNVGGRVPALVSMHSFTPIMHGIARPWEIGVLWTRDPRLPRPLMERLRAEGLTVGDNAPSSRADGPAYTQPTHGYRPGHATALHPVRPYPTDTPPGAPPFEERLSAIKETRTA